MKSYAQCLLLFCLLPGATWADCYDPVVLMSCDQSHDQVSVSVTNQSCDINPQQSLLVTHKGYAWNPWDLLIRHDPGNGDLEITGTRTVSRTCHLSDGIYHVRIGPVVGGDHVGRMCGASISAWVQIARGQHVIYKKKPFGSVCPVNESGENDRTIDTVITGPQYDPPVVRYQ